MNQIPQHPPAHAEPPPRAGSNRPAPEGRGWYGFCGLHNVFGLLGLCGALFLGACASGPPPRDNGLLNDGYSLLYQAASTLRFEDDFAMLKFKTQRFERVIDNISAYSARLKESLEQTARAYPAVHLDRHPLPEIEVARRTEATKAMLLANAPLVGRSGAAFERSVLLSNSGLLDHSRHLCKVMADAEPDPNLKRLLLDAERHYSALYDEVVALLDQVHFKPPTGTTR